jgi:hypothetical protein
MVNILIYSTLRLGSAQKFQAARQLKVTSPSECLRSMATAPCGGDLPLGRMYRRDIAREAIRGSRAAASEIKSWEHFFRV